MIGVDRGVELDGTAVGNPVVEGGDGKRSDGGGGGLPVSGGKWVRRWFG